MREKAKLNHFGDSTAENYQAEASTGAVAFGKGHCRRFLLTDSDVVASRPSADPSSLNDGSFNGIIPTAIKAPTVSAALRVITDPVAVGCETDLAGAIADNQPTYRSHGAFVMTESGLFFRERSDTEGEGEKTGKKISAAFEVLAKVRDPAGKGWALWLRWRDAGGKVHERTLPMASLHQDHRSLEAGFAERGLPVAVGEGKLLAKYLNEVPVDTLATTVGQTGWHEIDGRRVFVHPRGTFGLPQNERVLLLSADSTPYDQNGTLSGWQNSLGALTSGHRLPMFFISAALAGPLLDLIGLEGGGFHLHGVSSTGKSTIAAAAASVWGRGGIPGFMRSWRTTANGLEGVAALHSDTCLIFDELGMIDCKDACSVAYQLASGSGKTRMNEFDGVRSTLTWRVLFLSTGEVTLADKLAEARKRQSAGQAVRMVDLRADAGRGFGVFDNRGPLNNPKSLSDAIKEAARSHFGMAGPEFVRRIIEKGVEEIARYVKAVMATFRESLVPTGADPQVLRVADRFGLVAAAGEVAIELGILPWSEHAAVQAAGACFRDWLDARGGPDAHEHQAIVAQVRSVIEAHGDSRFVNLTKKASIYPLKDRLGYRIQLDGEPAWLVFPGMWRAEVVAGFDSNIAAHVLSEKGMLHSNKKGYQYQKKIDTSPQRFYCITSKIFSGTEEGDADVAVD
jgi:putative DNA primase/helicase